MPRRVTVELFEQLRREYEFGVGTIKGVAAKFGVHRRMVRQAIKSAGQCCSNWLSATMSRFLRRAIKRGMTK